MITPVQAHARENVLAALQTAAARTGSDFQYLLGTAMRESSLDARAQASTSSATGLFQFTGQTWFATMKAHGAEYGLSAFANAIHQNASGHYAVDSPELKQQILALRNDPQIAAFMAGEAAQDTRQSLEGSLCRRVSCGELYAAHFLGEAGARKLIAAKESDPSARADLAFPDAARANRNVFYHSDGTPKSVSEVYSWAVKMPAGTQGVGASADTPSGATGFTNLNAAPVDHSTGDDGSNVDTYASRRYMPMPPAGSALMGMSGLSQTPLALIPGVLEILASLDPSPTSRQTEN